MASVTIPRAVNHAVSEAVSFIFGGRDWFESGPGSHLQKGPTRVLVRHQLPSATVLTATALI
jgi:hypothetical protein